METSIARKFCEIVSATFAKMLLIPASHAGLLRDNAFPTVVSWNLTLPCLRYVKQIQSVSKCHHRHAVGFVAVATKRLCICVQNSIPPTFRRKLKYWTTPMKVETTVIGRFTSSSWLVFRFVCPKHFRHVERVTYLSQGTWMNHEAHCKLIAFSYIGVF